MIYIYIYINIRENVLMRPPQLSRKEADSLDQDELETFRTLKAKGFMRHHASMLGIQAHYPPRDVIIDPFQVSSHHPLGRCTNFV